MKGFFLVAVVGSSLLAAASPANAAGRGSPAPQSVIRGAAPPAPGDTASSNGQTGGAPSSSTLTTAPTIGPGAGDDQINLRRTIIRLPF